MLFKRKSYCCSETVSHGTPKSTENQKFSEECRIVSDTYTLYSQGCQNFTSLYRLVVSAPEGQRWFEKTGWDPNADQISQTRRKFKEAEDTAKCLLLAIPESLSYQSRLNQNPKLQAKSYIIRRFEKLLGNILVHT